LKSHETGTDAVEVESKRLRGKVLTLERERKDNAAKFEKLETLNAKFLAEKVEAQRQLKILEQRIKEQSGLVEENAQLQTLVHSHDEVSASYSPTLVSFSCVSLVLCFHRFAYKLNFGPFLLMNNYIL